MVFLGEVDRNPGRRPSAASEMPCAAPPTRVYPAGTATAELGAAGLAVTLADTVAIWRPISWPVRQTALVPGALLQEDYGHPDDNGRGHGQALDPYVHHCRLSWLIGAIVSRTRTKAAIAALTP